MYRMISLKSVHQIYYIIYKYNNKFDQTTLSNSYNSKKNTSPKLHAFTHRVNRLIQN